MARRPGLFSRLMGGMALPRARPYTEQGSSGTPVFGGFVATRERNPEWIGQQKYTTTSDIVTNVSIVAASVHYFLNIVARPKWTVVPVSDADPAAREAAEFVDEVIHSMNTPWNRVVRKSAMFRFHGYSIQEWIAKRRDDGRSGLLDVEVRPQHTIEQWVISENGDIEGVWQRSPQTNQLKGLPRSKIVYMVEDTLTDSPEGLGMFRHMAEPYNRLKRFLELEAISFERDLRGIPIGRAPLAAIRQAIEAGEIDEKTGAKMIQDMENFVSLASKSSNTGMLLDSAPYFSQDRDGEKVSTLYQWGLDLLQGQSSGLQELGRSIERIQREMARIIGTEQMLLGESAGSRALSEDKSRALYLTANSVLSVVADTYNKDIIDPIWMLNGFPDDIKPWFQAEDVTFRDVGEITAALRDMALAGAQLTPDDPAVDDIRDLLGVNRPDPDAVARSILDMDRDPNDADAIDDDQVLDQQ